MAGPGKGGKVKKMSQSKRAGLVFPVTRIKRLLRKGKYADRIYKTASVFCAAVLEYVTAELLEYAGDLAREKMKVRISPRYLQMAIRDDQEFDKLLSGVIIPDGGVIPHIHAALFPKKPPAKD